MRLFLTLFLVLSASSVYAESGCKKCERIREFHNKNPSKYTFYEDYKEAVEKGEIDPDDEGCPIEVIKGKEETEKDE